MKVSMKVVEYSQCYTHVMMCMPIGLIQLQQYDCKLIFTLILFLFFFKFDYCMLLISNNIGPLGGEAFARTLTVNSTLTRLSIQWNELEAGALHLSHALMVNSTLKILDVSWNELGDPEALALADTLKWNETLTWVDCSV